jgi:signal transduction histidine kinase
VRDLVEVSRLELAEGRAPLGPVDVAAVVADCAEGLRSLAAAKGVRVETRLDAGLPAARGDADKAAAVVQNLLDNAVKYSPPGAAVDAAVERDESGGVRLTVRDRGPGLEEAEKEAIFERYRQGRPSPFSTERGFGLGLHIVRSYVGLFGGRVAAENAPGGGARFVVVLPPWDASRDGGNAG